MSFLQRRSSMYYIVIYLLAICFFTSGADRVYGQTITVLKGATVIDGTGSAPVSDAVVVIENGYIREVGSIHQVQIPPTATVLDVSGRYLLPGFIDMHAHVAFGPVHMITMPQGNPGMKMDYDDEASRSMTRTLLAFGITTARNPGGPTKEAIAIRDDVRMGRLPGPRIFTAGSIIDLMPFPGLVAAAPTEAEIRAEVNRQADAGVDYVKLYASLGPEMMKSAIEEAHRRGVKVIAHTFFTSWTDAARLGIDGLVHSIPLSPALLPEDKRTAYLQGIRGTQFMYQWFQYLDLDSPEITDMIQALAENHVTVDPTLVVFDAMFRGNDPAVIENPDLKFTPESLVNNWRNDFTLSQGWSDADFAEAQAQWPTVLQFVRALHKGGVLITAGTDVPNPWVVPGASFHTELKLLTDTGIPPLEVLKIATHNGAQALGILSDVGTVQCGKRADLVLLKENPLVNIEQTRSIEWIMKDGTIVTSKDLLASDKGDR